MALAARRSQVQGAVTAPFVVVCCNTSRKGGKHIAVYNNSSTAPTAPATDVSNDSPTQVPQLTPSTQPLSVCPGGHHLQDLGHFAHLKEFGHFCGQALPTPSHRAQHAMDGAHTLVDRGGFNFRPSRQYSFAPQSLCLLHPHPCRARLFARAWMRFVGIPCSTFPEFLYSTL